MKKRSITAIYQKPELSSFQVLAPVLGGREARP
jgi:hypothetical protein